jgi:hypothetical protein
MLKQSIVYLILSILIVVFAQYAHLLMVYVIMFYTYIMVQITPIFSVTQYGVLIRNVVSLVFMPVIIAGIPALVYRAIKGKHMPYFFELTWALWLIIVLGKVLIR